MKSYTIQLTEEQGNIMDKTLKKWHISRSEYIRECVRYYQESENRDYIISQELSIIRREVVAIKNRIDESVIKAYQAEKSKES